MPARSGSTGAADRSAWELDFQPVHRGLTFLAKLRLRAIVFVIGIPLAAFGAISLGPAWLTLPLMGVAVAAVTMTLNRLTDRLALPLCFTCGADLAERPAHEHGIICPECGALNQHNPGALASTVRDDDAPAT